MVREKASYVSILEHVLQVFGSSLEGFPIVGNKTLGQTPPCCESFQTVDECEGGLVCNSLQMNSSGDVAGEQGYPDLSGSISLPCTSPDEQRPSKIHSGEGEGWILLHSAFR